MRGRTSLALALALVALAAPASAADRVGSAFLPDTSARRARPMAPDSGEHRTFRKTPAPLAQCDWFPLLEAGVARLNVTKDYGDGFDSFLFTNSAGLMRNVSERDALGGSLDAQWSANVVTLVPTLRWRHFFGRRSSAEASAGWVDNGKEGAHGPIAQLRYAPVPQVYVQAGTVQFRRWVWDVAPLGEVHPRRVSDTRFFAGAGCNGVPAAVTTVVEALALAVAFSVVMSD
ncbi:MAG: hypothetical protein HZA61_16650 [Candidatus Eisenbacteria bacterium]|uniref:Uncharacterized protein n=1 Tax=Eiseniibacteriota bacterium TaxID=2212470 RepID=A0A933W4J9_UNCEI|nr:hypothetical protein [Candidatus Eisenbacteria bacterium]